MTAPFWLIALVATAGLAGSPSAVRPTGAGLTEHLDGMPHVVLQLRGAVDDDVTALGVRAVLTHARGSDVEHVILVMDSPGGLLASGKAIGEQLREFESSFTYHAVVEETLGDCTWIVAECDHIWTPRDGRIGAALPYRRDALSGDAAEDAKLNAVTAAQLATAADRKGHPGPVFRAMMQLEAELWTWTRPDGIRAFSGRRPTPDEPAKNTRQIDTKETIVSFSGDVLVNLGLAGETTKNEISGLLRSEAFRSTGSLRAGSGRGANRRMDDARPQARVQGSPDARGGRAVRPEGAQSGACPGVDALDVREPACLARAHRRGHPPLACISVAPQGSRQGRAAVSPRSRFVQRAHRGSL
ncbi:MAG: hypothetical protein AAFX79_08610 [Planctomycetota bacterium]